MENTRGFWIGIMAPPGTPQEVVGKVASELKKALDQGPVRTRIEELGATPQFVAPADFRQVIQQEYQQWAAITREAGVVRQDVR